MRIWTGRDAATASRLHGFRLICVDLLIYGVFLMRCFNMHLLHMGGG